MPFLDVAAAAQREAHPAADSTPRASVLLRCKTINLQDNIAEFLGHRQALYAHLARDHAHLVFGRRNAEPVPNECLVPHSVATALGRECLSGGIVTRKAVAAMMSWCQATDYLLVEEIEDVGHADSDNLDTAPFALQFKFDDARDRADLSRMRTRRRSTPCVGIAQSLDILVTDRVEHCRNRSCRSESERGHVDQPSVIPVPEDREKADPRVENLFAQQLL
jgi:hypothetical protein